MKRLLTKTELAREMGLDTRALQKLIESGSVKPVANDGKGNPLFNSPSPK